MVSLDLADQLLQELRSINQRLAALESTIPRKDCTWLSPSEMATVCGVSTRTLQNYVNQGKLRPASYKREPRGKGFNFKYHRELALRDLGLR
jgi:hypothetical protein